MKKVTITHTLYDTDTQEPLGLYSSVEEAQKYIELHKLYGAKSFEIRELKTPYVQTLYSPAEYLTQRGYYA